MAKYSSPDMNVQVDNAGGTLVDISNYVDAVGGFAPAAETAESTGFGDAWREYVAHLKDGGEFTIEGNYDDTATTGPDAILNAIGSTRTVQLGWGGTANGKPKTSVEAIITKYERRASVGSLTRFVASMKSTGAVTEGTFSS